MYDFETRQSDSILKDELPPEGGETLLLNAPSTVDGLVRQFAAQVAEWSAAYLSGDLPRDEFEAKTREAAAEMQAVFYGKRPDLYFATTFHSPERLGAFILSFGPVAESADQAVYGLFGRLASQVIRVLQSGDENEPDEAWQAALDDLVENYTAILLGVGAPPAQASAG